MKIRVSWEEIQAGEGLDSLEEMWIKVHSDGYMSPSQVVPDVVLDQIDAEVIKQYNHRAGRWFPGLREDDDESHAEWPYEQWWTLPKVRTIA